MSTYALDAVFRPKSVAVVGASPRERSVGRAVVRKEGAGAGSVILNVVWIVLAGWWLALAHLVTAVAQAVTIIGIPLAIANLKMLPISLVPYGKQIVPRSSLPPGTEPLHSI